MIKKKFNFFFKTAIPQAVFITGGLPEVKRVLKVTRKVTNVSVLKFKGFFKQKHGLLGNTLLTQSIIRLIYMQKRGTGDSIYKPLLDMGLLSDSYAAKVRYLGARDAVFKGLETHLISDAAPLRPINFLDAPTYANLVYRIEDLEYRIDKLEKMPRWPGTPQWTCPVYNKGLFLVELKRGKALEAAHHKGLAGFMSKTGFEKKEALPYGLNGVKEALTPLNSMVRVSKKLQVISVVVTGGTLVVTAIKTHTGL